MVPEDLRYTEEHEWIRIQGEIVEVGITDYAQDALGDIVYLTLPAVGNQVNAGSACGEIESTKSVSEVYAPLDGVITERNEALDDAPQRVNDDAYGGGWLFRMRLTDPAQLDQLLTAAQYQQSIA